MLVSPAFDAALSALVCFREFRRGCEMVSSPVWQSSAGESRPRLQDTGGVAGAAPQAQAASQCRFLVRHRDPLQANF